MITEHTLTQLGFKQVDPQDTCWRAVAVGKAIHFRVHFSVTAEDARRLATSCNTTDPTAHLYTHFDVNGDTIEDHEFRALFQQWKQAHGMG